jgi:hypothetical protein
VYYQVNFGGICGGWRQCVVPRIPSDFDSAGLVVRADECFGIGERGLAAVVQEAQMCVPHSSRFSLFPSDVNVFGILSLF